MKKRILLLALTFCLVFGFSAIASARAVDFENHTDFHWVEMYIDYSGQGREWGENLLSGQVDRGEAVTIDIHGARHNLFKIKIVEKRHGEYYKVIWHDVNLEDASRVIMYYNHQTGEAKYKVVRG